MYSVRHYFVLGGARSGKSVFAEKLALELAPSCTYIATARVWDDEMRDRVSTHQARRKEQWNTLEAPLELCEALKAANSSGKPILIDCLTLWLTNLMMEERDIDRAGDELSELLPEMNRPTIFVSNEVGQGIVPDNKMAREFIDHAGTLHQKIAKVVNEVHFVTAGIPTKIKG